MLSFAPPLPHLSQADPRPPHRPLPRPCSTCRESAMQVVSLFVCKRCSSCCRERIVPALKLLLLARARSLTCCKQFSAATSRQLRPALARGALPRAGPAPRGARSLALSLSSPSSRLSSRVRGSPDVCIAASPPLYAQRNWLDARGEVCREERRGEAREGGLEEGLAERELEGRWSE